MKEFVLAALPWVAMRLSLAVLAANCAVERRNVVRASIHKK